MRRRTGKYDTTNTSRTKRKHSRRACRDGRRNRNRLDRLGNDQRGWSQSRCVHAGARARNSRHRVDRGDRFLRAVSRSLIFTGEAIDVARESAAHLSERKQQEAIAAAEQIIAKAREASAIEHERTMESLKRELGRLVVETTAKVTEKVLTPEDQRRLQEEAARQLA